MHQNPPLATKLHIPPIRPNLVPRPRLIERLDKGLRLSHKLTLGISTKYNISTVRSLLRDAFTDGDQESARQYPKKAIPLKQSLSEDRLGLGHMYRRQCEVEVMDGYYLLMLLPFDAYSGKSAVPSVDRNDLRVLLLVCPPPDEQHDIAAHLDHETAKLDALIAKVRALVERLQEYRTALISAAVTGKIDVRDQVQRTSKVRCT